MVYINLFITRLRIYLSDFLVVYLTEVLYMEQVHTLFKADHFSILLTVIKIITDFQYTQRLNIICGGSLNKTRAAQAMQNYNNSDRLLVSIYL